MTPTIAERLGAFAAAPAAFPNDVETMAKNIVSNAMALACASVHEEAAAIAFDTVAALRTPPHATVLGRGVRVGVTWAALLNGIAVHVEDFDDTHLRTLLHPGPVVVPAALAVAEFSGATGPTLLDAVALGVEVAMRIGAGISPSHYERGWHVTSTMGRCGAAIAASRVLRLDGEQTEHALAIAALEAGGVTAALGTMTKPLHPGKAAFDGIEAAYLARSGVRASPAAIEGTQGLAALMSDGIDTGAIFDGLGERWEMLHNSFKPYSCGLVSHPIIDAAIVLRDRVAIDRIERVDVVANPLVLQVMGKTDPRNGLESKFSATHCAAVGFLFGAAGPKEFTDACATDPRVRALRGRVAIETRSESPIGSAVVTVTDRDGHREVVEVPHATGSVERPMTTEQIAMKAKALAGEGFQEVLDAIDDLKASPDLSRLISAMSQKTEA